MDGSTPPDPASLLTAQDYYVIFVGNALTVAAAALYVYDVVLTLPTEIALVWPQLRPSSPTHRSKRRTTHRFALAVYLLTRYGLLIQAALGSMVSVIPGLDIGWCVSWNYASNWSIPAVLMLNEAMLIIRLSALYLNSQWVRYPLWTLYILCSTTTAVFTGLGLEGTYTYVTPPGTMGDCLLGGGQTLYWAIWLPSLVLETVIFSMSVYKIIQHWRAGAESRLLSVMARDGFLYFLLIFALLLVNLILCLTTSVVYYAMLMELTLCLTSMMCTRLYLNLRSVARAHEEKYAIATELTPPRTRPSGQEGVEEGLSMGETVVVDREAENYNDLTTTFWSDYGEEY